MRKRRNFRKKPKDNAQGLSVTVFNNNVEEALKRLKRKVKNSDLMQDLRKKEYYEKPSKIKREKRNLARLRNKYHQEKIKKTY
jgi:ribosomal protein S21